MRSQPQVLGGLTVSEIEAAVCNAAGGGTGTLAETTATVVSDTHLEAVMQRHLHGTVNTCCKVDATGGVPTIAWHLVEHPKRTRYDLSSLKGLSYGGAPSAPELARKIREKFRAAAPGTGWGMSETSPTFSSPFARSMKIALSAADRPRPLVSSKKDYWNKPYETTKPSLTPG